MILQRGFPSRRRFPFSSTVVGLPGQFLPSFTAPFLQLQVQGRPPGQATTHTGTQQNTQSTLFAVEWFGNQITGTSW
jgi:hypothetical protein